jgi:hypothetical protein
VWARVRARRKPAEISDRRPRARGRPCADGSPIDYAAFLKRISGVEARENQARMDREAEKRMTLSYQADVALILPQLTLISIEQAAELSKWAARTPSTRGV